MKAGSSQTTSVFPRRLASCNLKIFVGFSELLTAATIGERKKAKLLKKTAWWKNQLGKNQCYYCKKKFHPDELTMDHKISLSRGGKIY